MNVNDCNIVNEISTSQLDAILLGIYKEMVMSPYH